MGISVEDVPRGKRMTSTVFDVNDVERTGMTIAVSDETHTTHIVTACDHRHVACNNNKPHQLNMNGRVLSCNDVTMNQNIPVSNLMNSSILPVAMSTLSESLTLMRGSG